MPQIHRPRVVLLCLVSVSCLVWLAGCASTGGQRQFANSFLPPAPAPPDATADLPPVTASLYSGAKPLVFDPILTKNVHNSGLESRLQRADNSFEAGKRFYQQGDMDAARQQFNNAIDALLTAPEDIPDRAKLEHKLDELVDKIYRYDLDGLGSGETDDTVVYEKSPFDGILDMTFPTDPKLKPKVKEEIQATRSQLPLEENDSVLSFIHYFSTERGRKTLISGLRRAGRYSGMIHRILAKEGVPEELIYLAQLESGFFPHAISNKRCVGLWQFSAARGHEYGLHQTAFADDRLDPEKSTVAAAKHLKDLYNHFGDWYLAMASYDCGPGCVDRAVQRTGFADYWELRSRNVLPKETMNYVPVVLAVTIMAKNPQDYGLDVQPDPPIEFDTLDMKAPTNLNLISDASEDSVADLRDLNPSLLGTIAPAGFELRVPKGKATEIAAALESVPVEYRASWRMHRMEPGETVPMIARRFHTPANSIIAANHLPGEVTDAGELLVIPAAPAPRRVARRHSRRHSTVLSARNRKSSRHYASTRKASSHATARKTSAKKSPSRTASRHSRGAYRVASLREHRSAYSQ